MPFCGNCGSPVDGRFCAKCGTPISGQAPPPPTPEPPPPPAPPEQAAPPMFAPPSPPPPQQQWGQVPPPAAPQKSNVWKYFLFGCLGLIVIAVGIFLATGMYIFKKATDAGLDSDLFKKNPAAAAARMAVTMNPDLDLVSVDEDRQVLTVRQKSSGKTVTLNFEDAKNGHFEFTDDKGTKVQVGKDWTPPSWVPLYAGATAEGGAAADADGRESGGGSLKSSDSVDMVAGFYESALQKDGLTVTKHSTAAGANSIVTLNARDDSNDRVVNVVVMPEGSGSKIQLSYSRKQ